MDARGLSTGAPAASVTPPVSFTILSLAGLVAGLVLGVAGQRSGSGVIAGIAAALEPFGDIWLRDTGPLIVKGDGVRGARTFRFNGWGGKYELEGDDSVATRLATGIGLDPAPHDWVLEGGAIDVDGTGLAVTTEQCLLNPNRNPGFGPPTSRRGCATISASIACSGSAKGFRTIIPTAMSTISRASWARTGSSSPSRPAKTIPMRRSTRMRKGAPKRSGSRLRRNSARSLASAGSNSHSALPPLLNHTKGASGAFGVSRPRTFGISATSLTWSPSPP